MTRLAALLVTLTVLSACEGPSLPDTKPSEDDTVLDPGGGGVGGDGGGELGAPLPEPVWPELQTSVEHVAIEFGPETAAIVYELWSKVWAPGKFQVNGHWYDVDLRQRGDGAREHPKHSWKIRHPDGVAVDGQHTRNFLAEWPDGGYLSDPFSYALMLGAGVKISRGRLVTLDVNGEHQGVYFELQEPDDKYFLRDHELDPDANVYRCGLRDCEMKLGPRAAYQGDWEKKTNELEPREDLDRFLVELSRTPEHEFEAWVLRTLDFDRYARMYAAAILISWSGVDDSGSYLVHDRVKDRWIFVPWDLNNAKLVFWQTNDPAWALKWNMAIPLYTLYDPATLGVQAGKEARYGGAHAPFVVLFQRIWDVPSLRNRILDEAEQMMATVFSEEQAFARIERIRALVAPLLPADPWVSMVHADVSVAKLEEYVTLRRGFLAKQIPLERKRGEGGLVVNAISPAAIELFNRDDTPRDLGGLALTSNLRERTQQLLPAGTVVPPHEKITLPFTPGADGGEVGIFDATTRLPVDAVYYGPLGGRTYARAPDGAEAWAWR